jgi:hypothetical protein
VAITSLKQSFHDSEIYFQPAALLLRPYTTRENLRDRESKLRMTAVVDDDTHTFQIEIQRITEQAIPYGQPVRRR